MKYGLLLLIFITATITSFAQRNVTPAIARDPVMEADAKHNLDVAWQSYKLRKAYKGVLMRFEETFDTYPEFSKMDEFLYLAGMSSHYLSQGKGRQKIDLKTDKDAEKYTPERLKENSIVYLKMLVEKYPESAYRDEAEKFIKKSK